MAEERLPEFDFKGVLEGHENWVTCIASGHSQKENEDSQILVSGSRDKSLIIWKLTEPEDGKSGLALKKLEGHAHFISDLALSQENNFAISSSWDQTLRLWDLNAGVTTQKFYGHTKEVFTVAFSPDNRQIISAGADKKVILWNTLAKMKFESSNLNHTDWVSSVKYSPVAKSNKSDSTPYFATVGWDGRLKIWNTNIQVKNTFRAHQANINGVSISPNGRYIATGGKDKKLKIWEIKDLAAPQRELEAGSTIFQIAFNPEFQYVAAATEHGVKVWSLMDLKTKPFVTLKPIVKPREVKEGQKKKATKLPMCISLTWNSVGKRLFAGFTDGLIRVYETNNEY